MLVSNFFKIYNLNCATRTIAENFLKQSTLHMKFAPPLLFNDKRPCCRVSCLSLCIDQRGRAKGIKEVTMASLAK